MSCQHCCYSCGPKGEDMSLDTFRKAIVNDGDEMVSIGGGEPTVHPNFWEIIGLSLGHYDHVWLATNGKNTEIALALARMAKNGTIGCDLSRDAWHSRIDQRVVDAFMSDKNNKPYGQSNTDGRAIRNVGEYNDPILAGRCDWGTDGCVCGDLIVQPSGLVKACGCEDAPTFGNVNQEISIPDGWMVGECWQYNKSEGVLDLEQYA